MPISYAGFNLALEDPGGTVCQWLNRYLELAGASLFGGEVDAYAGNRHGSRAGNKHFVGLPKPNYPAPPKTRINTLYWPTGATRWACGVFLCDSVTKASIVALFEGSNRTNTPQQLVISGSEQNFAIAENGFTADLNGDFALSTAMYLLPPRPLSSPVIEDNWLWLLPLVDERWYWQFADSGAFEPTTWEEAFSDLEDALLVTIEADTIASDYDTPDETELNRQYENAAMLLDGVAHSVGQRIVRGIDGVVRSQRFDTAATMLDGNIESATGDFARVGGGDFSDTMRIAMFPASVIVVFTDESGGVAGIETVLAITVNPAYVSTSIAVKTIHVAAVYDDTASPDMALQIATDYYGWLDRRYDQSFAGVKHWKSCGYDDYMEFSVGERLADGSYRATTRVCSMPYNFGVSDMPIGPGTSSECDTIRFEIVSVTDDTATVTIQATNAGCGTVQGSSGEGNCTVDVVDAAGCFFLNEEAAALVGRIGYAKWMVPKCDYVEGDPQWEVISLCCPT